MQPKRSWGSPFSLRRKSKSSLQPLVFGVALESLPRVGESLVPGPVRELVAYITKHGTEVQGVFRISPAAGHLNALKATYDANGTAGLEGLEDVHTAASCLKLLLRELPEPLLPGGVVAELEEVLSQGQGQRGSGPDTRVAAQRVTETLAVLTEGRRQTLELLLRLLHYLCENEEKTRWSPSALSTVVGPNLYQMDADTGADLHSFTIQSNQTVAFLIQNYQQIYHPAPVEKRVQPPKKPGRKKRSLPQPVVDQSVNSAYAHTMKEMGSVLRTAAVDPASDAQKAPANPKASAQPKRRLPAVRSRSSSSQPHASTPTDTKYEAGSDDYEVLDADGHALDPALPEQESEYSLLTLAGYDDSDDLGSIAGSSAPDDSAANTLRLAGTPTSAVEAALPKIAVDGENYDALEFPDSSRGYPGGSPRGGSPWSLSPSGSARSAKLISDCVSHSCASMPTPVPFNGPSALPTRLHGCTVARLHGCPAC